jgi:hypothetical protein
MMTRRFSMVMAGLLALTAVACGGSSGDGDGDGDGDGGSGKIETECMKAPAESDGAEPCETPSSSCTATVGELQTCWNDAMAEGLAALAAMPGCEDVGKGSDVGPEDAPAEEEAEEAMPASCQVVEQKCPEALRSAR